MTETIYVPPAGHRRSAGGMWFPPLFIVAFILYNVIAFLPYGGSTTGWMQELLAIPMVSGVTWVVTSGDLMLVFGLVLLFLEILKSTRLGTGNVVEHMLSVVVFILFLIEFLLVRSAATSVFFILMLMSLMDVVAGFTVSITAAGRDVTLA